MSAVDISSNASTGASEWGYFALRVVFHAVVMWPLGAFLLLTVSSDYDIAGLFGIGIVSAFAATLTGALSLLVGLPLWIHARLRAWWSRSGALFLIGSLVAVAILVVAYYVGSAGWTAIEAYEFEGIDYPATSVYQPDWTVLAIGWFLLSFFILHTRRPRGRA